MHHWKLLSAAALLLAVSAPLARAATPFQKAEILPQRLGSGSPVSFQVYIPIQHRAELDRFLADANNTSSPSYHKWLTPAQFQQRFGASDSDLAAVQRDLAAAGLSVTSTRPGHFQVSGTAGTVERAFGTELHTGIMPNGQQRVAATEALTMPNSVQRLNGVVLGLSPAIRMHANSAVASPANRYSTAGPYWFTDLKQAYKFPSFALLTGRGSNIAVLMAGNYRNSDMAAYFGHEKLASNPNRIQRVNVNGGAPFGSADYVESSLDIQQAGGMAPRANVTLYNIPDLSDSSIIAGLLQILFDNTADVVNMSFGGPEQLYTAEYNGGVDYTGILRAEDDLFAQGNAQGITFVASSGDSGGLAVPPPACFANDATSACGSYLPGVQFPASSPHVTGVGGTNLRTTSSATNLDSIYIGESAFYDPLAFDSFYKTPATGAVWGSGGGDSIVFKKPAYQQLVKTGNPRYRTVPDVAGHEGGCPGAAISCSPDDSAVVAVVGGEYAILIGTSASAPDFAGLLGLAVERFGGRIGNANDYIYTLAAAQDLGVARGVFNRRIPGNNGVFSSGNDGYNRVLGNGTVNGAAFLLTPGAPLAGTPKTPSNP